VLQILASIKSYGMELELKRWRYGKYEGCKLKKSLDNIVDNIVCI